MRKAGALWTPCCCPRLVPTHPKSLVQPHSSRGASPLGQELLQAPAQASLLASRVRLLRGSVTVTQDRAPVVLTPASPCLQVLQDPSHSLFWCKALAQRFSPLSLLIDLVVNSHPCRNVPVNLCSPSSVPSSSRWKRVPSTQSLGRPGIR